MRKLSSLITVIGLDYRHSDFSLLHQSLFIWSLLPLYHIVVVFMKAVTAVSGPVNNPWQLKLIIFSACFYVSAGKMVHLRSLFFLLWTDNLLIDYQFTFSLIQEDDNHYTAINFMASPEQVDISYFKASISLPFFVMSSLLFLSPSVLVILKANKNLDMSINASNNFNLNITWSVGSTGTSLPLSFLTVQFCLLTCFKNCIKQKMRSNLLAFSVSRENGHAFTRKEILICRPTQYKSLL